MLVLGVAGFSAMLVASLVAYRRLVAAEALKILSHPFFYVSLIILVTFVVLWTEIQVRFTEFKSDEYRTLNSFLVFCYGARPGLKIATFVLAIFSSMTFAGEFDRGTIKNLLTRPVTRTELFIAKCSTMAVLSLVLMTFVFYLCGVLALFQGEAGHVWREDVHQVYPTYEAMMSHWWRAVGMCILPIMATSFLGVLVSNMTESSGYAVAAALIVFFVMDILATLFQGDWGRYLFNYYQAYPFEVLVRYARGDNGARWDELILNRSMFATVPAIYSGVFAVASYLCFRFKNITV